MPLNRREFLGFVGGAAGVAMLGRAATAWAQSATAPAGGKWNFVFILADDLGWRDLSCQGSRFYLSPNIDKLAEQGMRFTQAYAACPVCSPTRASILTGKYPARLGITDWIPGSRPSPNAKLVPPRFLQQLPLEEVTIAEYLKAAGYATACIGKWHLGAPAFWPEKQGFDVNVAANSLGNPRSYFSPYKMQRLADGPEGEYLTDRLTDEACKFITDNKGRPFLLYLPHFAVHAPLQAKQELIEKFKARVKPDDPQKSAVYAAMIASMDEGVGKVMAKLDELHLAENTVVIFFSDNGGFAGATSNRPLYGFKSQLFEGGIRVPLIVRWPGAVKPATTCDTPVISTDFLPTMLEMAGLKADPKIPCDGASLTPLLRQAGKLQRDSLFWHYPHYQGGQPASAIRQGDWKLIHWIEEDRNAMFNLAQDIGEKDNLLKNPDAAAKAKGAELRAALDAWRKSVNALMPTRNPNYTASKPAGQPSGEATP